MFIIQENESSCQLVKYESIAAVEISDQFMKIIYSAPGHDSVHLNLKEDLRFRYPNGELTPEEEDFMEWVIQKQREVQGK